MRKPPKSTPSTLVIVLQCALLMGVLCGLAGGFYMRRKPHLPSRTAFIPPFSYFEMIESITAITWHPDGETIALAVDTLGNDSLTRPPNLMLWNPAEATLPHVEKPAVELDDCIKFLSFNPEGTLLASGGRTQLNLWSNSTRTLFRQFKEHSLYGVEWSPDGQQIAAWDAPRAVVLHPFAEKAPVYFQDRPFGGDYSSPNVLSFGWSSDGRFVATTRYDHLFVWEAATGRRLAELKAIMDDTLFAWHPSHALIAVIATVDNEERILFWEPLQRRRWTSRVGYEQSSSGVNDAIIAMAWSPDGKSLATGRTDGTVTLWNDKGERLAVRSISETGVEQLSWSPNGEWLAAQDHLQTHLLDTHSSRVRVILPGTQPTWSPDGTRLLTLDGDTLYGALRLWNIEHREHLGLAALLFIASGGRTWLMTTSSGACFGSPEATDLLRVLRTNHLLPFPIPASEALLQKQ